MSIPLRRAVAALALTGVCATSFVASAECSFNTGVTFDLSGGRATY